MNLSCLQENLNKGLAIVGRAVATRTTLPITNNVLLATDGSRLKLSATNLEIAISCWIGAMVEKEGAITVPARLLTEFINSLPNDKIDINLIERTLELKCARFEARISGIDAADFPPVPQVDPGMTYQIEPDALRTAINQVVFATASEDTRPVLTGVCCEFEGDTLTLAAADGFRLAVYKAPMVKAGEQGGEIIVPGRTLAEIARLLSDQEETVEIAVNKNKSQILFRLKDVEIVSQLIQGTFPNYKQLIPQSYSTRAIVNSTDFLRATKTASIFARDGSGIVRIQISPAEGEVPAELSISASSEQLGDDEGKIDAKVEGEASKIAFNGRYILDVVSVLREGELALETTTSSSPGVIRPIGSDNYIHIVMPMFVQW